MLGSKKVARFNGCFGFDLSVATSGKAAVLGKGEPPGEAALRKEGFDAGEEGAGGETSRLNPMLSRPPMAFSVPPTVGG